MCTAEYVQASSGLAGEGPGRARGILRWPVVPRCSESNSAKPRWTA